VIGLKDIFDAGVVGAGGAGFPAHVKLSSRVDTVLVNAAECEPLLHKDKEILRVRGDSVLVGLATAMDLTGADRGIVAIKGKNEGLVDSLRGGLASNMSVFGLKDAYPAGDELMLVQEVLDRVVRPGGIPPEVGAVVINVETAMNIALAGQKKPVTEKFLTVGGAVAGPVTLRVPVGISMAQCVAAAGGATVDDPHYLVGGVMMGYLEGDHAALVDKTTGGIVVLPGDHVAVRRRRRDWKQVVRIARSACDQCSFCTELCPRYLLGHPIEPHRAMRSLGFSPTGQADVPGSSFCCECGLCSLYACPEGLDPKAVCAENKRRLMDSGQKWQDPPFNPRRPEVHLDDRRAPMHRLMTKLELAGFNDCGPLNDTLLTTDRAGVKLKQHVGAACQAAVKVGQRVNVGDIVGVVPRQNGELLLGAPVHASIPGQVTAIEDNVVWIGRE
jgi:Na+-translocating ferredoxin:NAD+ oxidoreductase RnfC subunit